MRGMTISVGVIGGRGFVGGELLRLLLSHPHADAVWATSESRVGERVDVAHPPLRGSPLRYSSVDAVPDCDLVFVAAGHGKTVEQLDRLSFEPPTVIDLGADFRLPLVLMDGYYDWTRSEPHAEPWVFGLPEINHEEIRQAQRVAVPGCMATAAILMLQPLHLLGLPGPFHVDARTGSSGAGSDSSHNTHALRANVMRVSAPLRHRHQAEISYATGGAEVSMTVTALPQVRGVQTLCRVNVTGYDAKSIRSAYAQFCNGRTFVRFLGGGRGRFALPDPKVLLGSNLCDISVVVENEEALAIAALDNLVKGAAGNAVQCMNVMHDWDERAGLEFPGLHPI